MTIRVKFIVQCISMEQPGVFIKMEEFKNHKFIIVVK